MRFSFVHLCWVMLLVGGCSTSSPAPANHAASLPTPEPYVRVVNTESNRIELQIAARAFSSTHHGRPVVWLTAVSHIGDTNYYEALQKHLNACSLVLYEGVGAAESEATAQPDPNPEVTPSADNHPEQNDDRGSLQSAMAASLGLVFQLNAIDYHRRNFRNSDLSISQLRALMSSPEPASKDTGAGQSFEDLLQVMQGNSWLDSLLQLALRMLGTSPKFQGLGRLALIDLLAEIQGDPSRLQGLPPDMKQLLEVLLQRRNEKVIADLKSKLPRIAHNNSVAIFFGAGHMPDLEKKLREQLGYRPHHEIWFTAFRVDLTAANISTAERQFVDQFVQWQLKGAGGLSHSAN